MLGAVKLARNAITFKLIYGGKGAAFDGTGSWSFSNLFHQNVIFFCVVNSSSIHSDNRKYIFLVLGLGPIIGINDSVGTAEKKFTINFTKNFV